MKLVIATPLYPPEIGGPATYAKLLEEGLPARGIEVEVVKFSEVRHLPKILRHHAYFRRVLKAARSADLVLALDPVSVGAPAIKAARKAGKPLVVKIVGDYAWEQGRQRFGITDDLDTFVKTAYVPFPVRVMRRIETLVALDAVRIIVPSEYLKGIVTAWGVPGEKIEVIYNAVPIKQVGVIPESVAALTQPFIATVGRLVPWKHVDGVIDAVKDLPGHFLVIVGDGPLRAELEAYARGVLGDRVLFTGALSHEDTLAVMQAASAFVLNSSYEGLSHVLIEALMLGTPVIATDAGGNREVVNGYGELIPVGDTTALVHALRGMHAGERSFAGDTRFREETMLAETATLLKSLV